MSEDFYPFIGVDEPRGDGGQGDDEVRFATRIAIYDDMLSTPRVIVIDKADVRTYLDEITNTVYRSMREQGGRISLMVIRELVENFIHASFTEPVVSILDGGNTVRFADQGPGIDDKDRAFEFGITSATQSQKRYIRGTGAGLPMVEQYLENAGGAISIEDNLNQGTVVTVSVDPSRMEDIAHSVSRGAVVRGGADARPTNSTGGSNQSFQQSLHNFSTNQQQSYRITRSTRRSDGGTNPPRETSSIPRNPLNISERGVLALQYLSENGIAGPTELAAAYGESTPTWSRELATLSSIGLVVKQGQKRVLTEVGRMWIQQYQQQ